MSDLWPLMLLAFVFIAVIAAVLVAVNTNID